MLKDPLGVAILEFEKNGFSENITVHSDICDDDVLPVPYLFRTFKQMPELEKQAVKLCKGYVLEVGSGAGCHAQYLKSQNFKTFSIDTSEGAISYLKSKNIPCENIEFLNYNATKFDTILILMNGLGLAGKLHKIEAFLLHAKSLLNKNGCIITDSSDIRYLYEDDEGGVWIDLNSKYPGEMEFQMEYKKHKTDWFSWVYIDFETLESICTKIGLKATKIMEDDNFHYLTKIEMQ